MTPLTLVQVALKNNVDVLYFGTTVAMNVYFSEDGTMGTHHGYASWVKSEEWPVFCLANSRVSIYYILHLIPR